MEEAVTKKAVRKGDTSNNKRIGHILKNMIRPAHVTWLSKKEIKTQSIAVLVIAVATGLILAGFDILLSVALRVLA